MESKNVSVEPYELSSEDPISIKNTVKDLEVFSTNDLLFKEHMKKKDKFQQGGDGHATQNVQYQGKRAYADNV